MPWVLVLPMRLAPTLLAGLRAVATSINDSKRLVSEGPCAKKKNHGQAH